MNTLPASISMVSVMLRVANLDAMTRYYSDVLGLKVIAEDVSSRVLGGDKQTLGLGDVSIVLPDSESYGETIERLNHYGLEAKGEQESKASFDDPWGNQVRLLVS